MASDLGQELVAVSQEARALRNRLWRWGIALATLASFLSDRNLGLEVKEDGVEAPTFWPYRRGMISIKNVSEAMSLQEILSTLKKYYELEEKRHELCRKLAIEWSPVPP